MGSGSSTIPRYTGKKSQVAYVQAFPQEVAVSRFPKHVRAYVSCNGAQRALVAWQCRGWTGIEHDAGDDHAGRVLLHVHNTLVAWHRHSRRLSDLPDDRHP